MNISKIKFSEHYERLVPDKFVPLIECFMRNIFLEKSYTKCGGKTSPRCFYEKLKLSISLDQYSKVLYNLLKLYDKLRAIKLYRN